MSTDLSLLELRQTATELAKSTLLPALYKGRPENIIAVALTGQEFGWGISTAMRFVQVVDGKPTVTPEGMLALVRRAGHAVNGSTTPERAEVTGTRKDTGDSMTVTFTMDDAKRANLTGKGAWRTYPEAMLWARAVAMLCRRLFSDVLLGAAYTAEEMGAAVNAENIIDADIIDAEVIEPDPVLAVWERVLEAIHAYPEAAETFKAMAAEWGTKFTQAALAQYPDLRGEVVQWLEQNTGDGVPVAVQIADAQHEAETEVRDG